MEFFDRLEAIRKRWNVLEHPFYERWSRGELSPGELAFYAGEYRHAVVALAEALESADDAALAEHGAEERGHVALWDAFAAAAGAETARPPRPETEACREAFTAGVDPLETLATTYAIESAQPAISGTKLHGLITHYGFEEGPATEYFSLHAERDVEHAEESRLLIEERIADADLERLLAVAEAALRGNWELLDGVERARLGEGPDTASPPV